MSKNTKKLTGFKALSDKQKTELFFGACKTRDELKSWIKLFLGLDLPDVTVSRYADSNPLDIIWEIYNICVLESNPELIEELLVVAGRGSGKTLAIAIAETFMLFHDQRDVAHVGAILSQAKRCYEYMQGFFLNERVKPILEGKSANGYPYMEKTTQEKSIFNIPDKKTKEIVRANLEVLPCTLKAVNGFHGAFVSVDEIDTVTGEGFKAFADISGMLDSKRGRKALRVGISTRKSRYGLMNKQIEEAEKAGRTIRKWTALEFSERCPDERSGTKPTTGYVNMDTLECIDEKQFNAKEEKTKSEYEKVDFFGEKCLRCPIAALCRSDAKKQTSNSTMLKPIGDVIKKTRENGPDWAISQLFNLKPSVEGIVYKEFEESKHVQDWNGMWKILTGQDYPGECTHDIFVKKCHQMKLSCYGGIDWGWSNPSTVVYLFVDNRENVFVVRSEGRTYTSNPVWAQTIKAKWHQMYRCQMYYPDLANPGDAVILQQEGLPCPNELKKDTNSGIQVVKKWLRSLASPIPKLYIAKETNAPLIKEFGLYHYKTDASGKITDDVAKEFDHWLDPLRYMIYSLFGSSTIVSAFDEYEKGNLVDSHGNYNRMPTVQEFAVSKNLNINTEVDKSKLGKIGTKSQLDEEDDEDLASGNGGFLWSF